VDELNALRSALEFAVGVEDYQQAAKIRDQIRQVELADPLTTLRAELEGAIAEERYVSVLLSPLFPACTDLC